MFSALPYFPVLAQETGKGFDFSLLWNAGVCGVILAWTMWRAEPRLRGIEAAIDRLTRMIAIMLTELPHVLQGAKDQCRVVMGELNVAARNRGEKPDSES